ncbi:MAG: FlgD immunoglobulin-like domain containing protein, partial [Candidatus Cloacimonadaceae bacterium]|nr:FlgD immunoglobulin-like domain containing protein [Candidatus Cloacimonadaceae bacterium]
TISYLPDGRYDRIDHFYFEGDWVPAGYSEFTYNGNQVDSLNAYYVWDGEEYLVSSMVFEYNAQSGYVEYLTEFYNWYDRYLSRQQFAYDNNGRPNATVTAFSWDGIDWQEDQRSSISYHVSDTGGYNHFYGYLIDSMALGNYVLSQMMFPFKVLQELSSYFDPEFETWVHSQHNQYLYDQDDRLDYIDMLYYEVWDQAWVHYNRYAYSYNVEDLLASIINYYVEDNSSFYESQKWEFVYENYSHSDDQYHSPALAQIRAFPNPFVEGIKVEISQTPKSTTTIAIYNTRGQRIRMLTNSASADISHTFYWDGKNDKGISVASGIYWVKVHGETGFQPRKILKLK